MDENTRLIDIKGIGPKSAALFTALGLNTAGELLSYYPRGYNTYQEPVSISSLHEGYIDAAAGFIPAKLSVRRNGRKTVTTGKLRDETGEISIMWFNQPYLRASLPPGTRVILRAKVTSRSGSLMMEQPEIYLKDAYDKRLSSLQPIYSLTAGLTNNLIARTVRQCLDEVCLKDEFLPRRIIEGCCLVSHEEALNSIHFPETVEKLCSARKRLVFEEFFVFITALRTWQKHNTKTANLLDFRDSSYEKKLLLSLPFKLTAAQERVRREISSDMRSEYSMTRLVQGDVGSGKTILALCALLTAAGNGFQGAMMAPTEVLAEQHFKVICGFLEKAGIPVKTTLLTGAVKGASRREAVESIKNGETQIIIGTHALIQEAVEYKSLAIVITDEQHRFGVRQREKLAGKGSAPHILVMSATPIPRTLAMILYGDLDISIVDERPADRLPIKTCFVDTTYRDTAYKFIEKQIAMGRQAYIICPFVSESEALEGEDVISVTEKVRKRLPSDITVEYLHGKMRQDQKNAVMDSFAEGRIQILVSTTVIEVGVDVPNATVMMIENTERFGLSALHQLRGRVGRGPAQSYCILVSGRITPQLKEKMDILCSSGDGFYIAEQDLKLRGPGEFFGVRQSGLPDFRIGDVYGDADILKAASDAVNELLEKDPELKEERNSALRLKIVDFQSMTDKYDI